MLAVLGAVAGSILAGFLFRLEGTVSMVGALPSGWPAPALDRLGAEDIAALAGPAELVLVEGVPGFHDVTRHPDGTRIPGLTIVRFDAPLFFANGQVFVDHVRLLVDRSPVPVRCVIVAAEAITGIDSTAVEQLVQLDEYLHAQGTVLVFAEIKGPIKDKLARFGPETRLGQARHYPTLESAVDAWRQDPDSG